MFLTRKQWALLHDIASQGMPALQISDLRFKQTRKSLKFSANCGTQLTGLAVFLFCQKASIRRASLPPRHASKAVKTIVFGQDRRRHAGGSDFESARPTCG
jgi:hypothetical protein